MQNENDFYETHDLPLVAALMCFGSKIDSVERNGGPRATFYLQRQKGLDTLVENFYSHKLQVDPILYFNCLKEAKSRLYGSKAPITLDENEYGKENL
jgi:hypothetical protein